MTKAALQTAYVLSEDLGTSLAERLFTSPRRFARPAREREVLAGGAPLAVEVTRRSPRWRATGWPRVPGLVERFAPLAGRDARGARTRIAAWRWGTGPAVLLVHGWEGRGTQLGGFIEPLVRAGFSVVAFDAPGHGDSPGHRLYLTDMADCIAEVARQVGPLHATIAHSFGAAATLVAHRRGGVDAARNVMIAPNVLIGDTLARFAQAVALDDRDRGALASQLASHSGLAIHELDLERLVGERDAALLVVHDRADREVPVRHGEHLAAAWRGARLQLTEGLGHRRILRDHAVIAEAIGFISDGTARPAGELARELDRLLGGADL